MMYSEFVENTECKDNEYNYKVFTDLEKMYMADDTITKETIYEYGKKLVNNEKSEKEIEAEKEINSEIEAIKKEINWNKQEIEFYKDINDKANEKIYINMNKANRRKIKELKHIFNI